MRRAASRRVAPFGFGRDLVRFRVAAGVRFE
ncbi:hypothetical protein SCE1572_30725 [Sorangium cellulosum So0157-2]|uniref:Uncharacterized protein n=1 Tax=Sorangium cellulosum So0157-2 TaxID=1254432 RepID=S4Y2U8_SORCE|nr:hypothetical protein SCE1572_30725 [Sorangium cellulosum So0157-2]